MQFQHSKSSKRHQQRRCEDQEKQPPHRTNRTVPPPHPHHCPLHCLRAPEIHLVLPPSPNLTPHPLHYSPNSALRRQAPTHRHPLSPSLSERLSSWA
ncbi:hypothetical protein KC19_1G158700 [Ceratodon purpureus]|uniref:Uncharacterized protein n=1 Tax=Ceratodon purpureus TaxID=3225 RepID=A0A8T0J8L2_CERPU|nr:hypothetical protein KC19_1G158700 [Ceratodon purpureus]